MYYSSHLRHFIAPRCRYAIPPYNRRVTITRRSKPELTSGFWKTPPTISITGYSRFGKNRYHFAAQFCWFCAVVVSISMCAWQLWECTCRFTGEPTLQTVSIHTESVVQFPALYVCPGFMRDFLRSLYRSNLKNCNGLMDSKCFNDAFDRVNYESFLDLVLTDMFTIKLEKIWKLFGINKTDTVLYKQCMMLDNCTSEGREWNVSFKAFNTFLGSCISLDTVYEQKFAGPLTNFKLTYTHPHFEQLMKNMETVINKSKDNDERNLLKRSFRRTRTGLIFYLHYKFRSGLQHELFFKASEIFLGFTVNVQMRKKVFKTVNLSRKRCSTDKDEIIDCLARCLEKNLSTTCRMPYSYPDVNIDVCDLDPLSKEEEDFRWVHLNNYEAYSTFNYMLCNCIQPCEEIVYTPSVDVIEKTTMKNVKVKFYFSHQTYETTTEREAYQFTAFLSDIGGNLGFFLGFCVLNILEIIEVVVFRVTNNR